MPVIYQACDIFCIPSKGPNETWGLAINEAMVCGKAILSSDKVGAAVDLVKPGHNGLMFKSGDLAGLIAGLNELLNSGKNRLGEMGRYSKEIIKDWSLENQVTAIEQLTNNE
jgi:glycosyltransferase involved in cell wall biosynthesis